MAEGPIISRRDILKGLAATAVLLGVEKISKMSESNEQNNPSISKQSESGVKDRDPITGDLRRANAYLRDHRGDFEAEIKKRHPDPTEDKKRLLELEKEIRDFNLQLAGQTNEQGEWIPTNPDVTHDTLPSPIPPPEDSLRRELEQQHTIEDPLTGQKFTAVMLNWDKTKDPGEDILLTLPGFNNTAEPKWWNKHTLLKGEYIARQTGKPVLIIDHPGYGSDRQTAEQRIALESKEDYAHIDDAQTPKAKLEYVGGQGYGRIAEAEIRAFEALGIPNDVTLFGGSMGAWSVAKVAEIAALREQVAGQKPDSTETSQHTTPVRTSPKPMHVNNLVLVDYPGMTEFTSAEMIKVMMTESKLLTLYKTTHPDPKFREYTMQTAPRWKQVLGKAHELMTTFTGDPGNGYKIAMGRPTLPQTLSTAMEANPDLQVKLITGTESLLSPREANNSMYAKLKQKYTDRVHRELFPGETHLLMENPGRYSGMISRSIRPQRKT